MDLLVKPLVGVFNLSLFLVENSQLRQASLRALIASVEIRSCRSAILDKPTAPLIRSLGVQVAATCKLPAVFLLPQHIPVKY